MIVSRSATRAPTSSFPKLVSRCAGVSMHTIRCGAASGFGRPNADSLAPTSRAFRTRRMCSSGEDWGRMPEDHPWLKLCSAPSSFTAEERVRPLAASRAAPVC
jgi:hypothetical protein